MRIPIATYRIQFNPQFDFKAACAVINYLYSLGISDIYASPIFKSKKGSLHGYDVIDHTQINPELGGQEGFEQLIRLVHDRGLGWLQDIVTNHMAYISENLMLMDVLENGPHSKYFKFFDIEWDHHFENLKGRVLAPFLKRFYAEVLLDGELQLRYGQNGFTVCYFDIDFPLRINSYKKLLRNNIDTLQSTLGKEHPDFKKFSDVLNSLDTLIDTKEVHFQYEHIKSVKETLWELYQKNFSIKSFIEENVSFFNGKAGVEESFNSLDALICEQAFRLSFWKVAIAEINYRRFFNINELISLRIEDNDVFNYAHDLIFKLAQEGKISGLRIDHVDGLYDPAKYVEKIRQITGPLYIVVEKILCAEEKLPSDWESQGTTGYDFMNYVNGIFCEEDNEKDFIKIYYKFTGSHISYNELIYKNKLLALRNMSGTIENLAYLMKKISGNDRYGRDITFYELKRALVEFMVNFPVYRTYINQERFSEADKAYIKDALNKSYAKMPGLFYELNFITKFFFPESIPSLSEEQKKASIDFVMRLQQCTGPLMAKGFEDTVLYLYNKLISLNEVGGNPNRFGVKVKEFHAFNKTRINSFPHSMNATSTHDTKRGEDVRARINVLSELPAEWKRNLKLWSAVNLAKKKLMNNKFMPDENDEYFLYQTLIGCLPFYEEKDDDFKERIKNYMVKAVREAKVHTAWIKPDNEYEQACLFFIDEILKRSAENQFLKEFLPFQKKIAFYGIFNSLSQTILKMTSPGLPDFYQGTELWDFNLVDPDNRRPVDFKKRSSYLEEIIAKEKKDTIALISELFSSKEDGKIKLFLTYRVLKARKTHSDIFQKGDYISLKTGGNFKEHIVSFLRVHGDSQALIIAPRLFVGLIKEGSFPLGNDVWQDTFIIFPKGKPCFWSNMITGETVLGAEKLPVGSMLESFPVALLIKNDQ